MPRVIVTRPAPEAARWVREFQASGIDAVALPLIEIVPEPMQGALAQARARLDEYHAVMFVSGNAVHGFLEQKTPHVRVEQALSAINTVAWSPGPGTTAALRAAGWPAARIDAPAADAPQFDSETLWARVAPQASAGRRVLIVRGGDTQGRIAGRDWLAARLAEAGVQVDQVLAYRRAAPRLGPAQCALAEAAVADGSLWLFSSSEAIANLRAALPRLDVSRAAVLATHPRIAQAARAAGFGTVRDTRPALDAVVASIESFA